MKKKIFIMQRIKIELKIIIVELVGMTDIYAGWYDKFVKPRY